MKKNLLLFTSLFILAGHTPVFAQNQSDTSQEDVTDLETEIEEKKAEIEELEAQLKELSGDSEEKEDKEDKPEKDSKVIGETFEFDGIEVTIEDLYLSEERDEYEEKEYDNVLVIEYTLLNNTEEEYYTGSEFELYVDGSKASDYYMMDTTFDSVSKGRKVDCKVAFGFNGEPENMELEFSQLYSMSDTETVVIPLEDVEER